MERARNDFYWKRGRFEQGATLLELLICAAVLAGIVAMVGSHTLVVRRAGETTMKANQLNEIVAELAAQMAAKRITSEQSGQVWYVSGKGLKLRYEDISPEDHSNAVSYAYTAKPVQFVESITCVNVTLTTTAGVCVRAVASFPSATP